MFASIQALIDSMTPEVYEALKKSVELGKWPTGVALTDEQKSLSMQTVIAYEQQHMAAEQRSGYISPQKHTHCGSLKGEVADDPVQPLTIKPLNTQE